MTASNLYPFLTKAQIKEQLLTETDFVHTACLILAGRQTDDERETKDTKWKNRRGFMSSHAKFGTEMAEKLAAGEELSEEQESKLSSVVCHYTKQLAAHFRAEALESNPELAEQGRVFGV